MTRAPDTMGVLMTTDVVTDAAVLEERVHELRDVMTLVPRVLLSVTLAGPAPSGSAGTSRLCQDCPRPSQHLPGQAVLSFTAPLRQGQRQGLPPHSNQQRLTAHRTKSLAANPYGARGSSLALMTSVGTASRSGGDRSAARFDTNPSKTAPSRRGLSGKGRSRAAAIASACCGDG